MNRTANGGYLGALFEAGISFGIKFISWIALRQEMGYYCYTSVGTLYEGVCCMVEEFENTVGSGNFLGLLGYM